jgi:hypothetical protein
MNETTTTASTLLPTNTMTFFNVFSYHALHRNVYTHISRPLHLQNQGQRPSSRRPCNLHRQLVKSVNHAWTYVAPSSFICLPGTSPCLTASTSRTAATLGAGSMRRRGWARRRRDELQGANGSDC